MSNSKQVPSSLLPTLPTLDPKHYTWKGDQGDLAYFLRMFEERFSQYGDIVALSFLQKCIPPTYQRGIQNLHTLKSALKHLSQWTASNKLCTDTILQDLRNIPQSDSHEMDKNILTQQLMQLQKCLDLNPTLYMDIKTVLIHIAKYHEATLYPKTLLELTEAAYKANDSTGRLNYIYAFIASIKKRLHYMQQRIAADQINRLPLQNGQDTKLNALKGPISTKLAAITHENMMNAIHSDDDDIHDRLNSQSVILKYLCKAVSKVSV